MTGYNSDTSAISTMTLTDTNKRSPPKSLAQQFTHMDTDHWLRSLERAREMDNTQSRHDQLEDRPVSLLCDDVFDDDTDDVVYKPGKPMSLLKVDVYKKMGHSFSTHSSTSTVMQLDIASRLSLAGHHGDRVSDGDDATLTNNSSDVSAANSSANSPYTRLKMPPPPPVRHDSLPEAHAAYIRSLSVPSKLPPSGFSPRSQSFLYHNASEENRSSQDTDKCYAYPSDDELLEDLSPGQRERPKVELPIAFSRLPLPTDGMFNSIENRRANRPSSLSSLRNKDSSPERLHRVSWSRPEKGPGAVGSAFTAPRRSSSGAKKKPSIILSGNALLMAKQLSEDGKEFSVEVSEAASLEQKDRTPASTRFNTLPEHSTVRSDDGRNDMSGVSDKSKFAVNPDHGFRRSRLKPGLRLFGSLPRPKKQKESILSSLAQPQSLSPNKSEGTPAEWYNTLPRVKAPREPVRVALSDDEPTPVHSASQSPAEEQEDVHSDFYSDYQYLPLKPSDDTVGLPRHFSTKKEDLPDVGFGTWPRSPKPAPKSQKHDPNRSDAQTPPPCEHRAAAQYSAFLYENNLHRGILNRNANNSNMSPLATSTLPRDFSVRAKDGATAHRKLITVTATVEHNSLQVEAPEQPAATEAVQRMTSTCLDSTASSEQKVTASICSPVTLPAPVSKNTATPACASVGAAPPQAASQISSSISHNEMHSAHPSAIASPTYGTVRSGSVAGNNNGKPNSSVSSLELILAPMRSSVTKNGLSGHRSEIGVLTNGQENIGEVMDETSKLYDSKSAALLQQQSSCLPQASSFVPKSLTSMHRSFAHPTVSMATSKTCSAETSQTVFIPRPPGGSPKKPPSRLPRPSNLPVPLEVPSPETNSPGQVVVASQSTLAGRVLYVTSSPSSNQGSPARVNITHIDDNRYLVKEKSPAGAKLVITASSSRPGAKKPTSPTSGTASAGSSEMRSPMESPSGVKTRSRVYVNVGESPSVPSNSPGNKEDENAGYTSPTRARTMQLRKAFFSAEDSNNNSKTSPVDAKFKTWSPGAIRAAATHIASAVPQTKVTDCQLGSTSPQTRACSASKQESHDESKSPDSMPTPAPQQPNLEKTVGDVQEDRLVIATSKPVSSQDSSHSDNQTCDKAVVSNTELTLAKADGKHAMTAEDLFATIHRSKKKMNIKTGESVSPSLRPSSPIISAMQGRSTPETGVLSPQARPKSAQGVPYKDKSIRSTPTSMYDFKMLLAQQTKNTAGIDNKKRTAAEALKVSDPRKTTAIPSNAKDTHLSRQEHTVVSPAAKRNARPSNLPRHRQLRKPDTLSCIREDAGGEKAVSPPGVQHGMHMYISSSKGSNVQNPAVDEAAVEDILNTIANTQKVLSDVTDV